MDITYIADAIETEIQQQWQREASFKAHENSKREKFFCLSMLPYPSGDLHMGHLRNYTIGDMISRYQTLLGKHVMQPMAWDAFGLPAENAALKHQASPAAWTYANIHKMRQLLKRMGLAIDWEREFTTCDPKYYHWEQWLFIKMYEKGLVYRKNSIVNWDPVDQTVLANEQVINGRGWRSGALVERKIIPQWFLKITDYADELLDDLDQLSGWPEQVRIMQKNWIGRSSGANVSFQVKALDQKLEIFTTRADTLMGATYIAIAAEHPIAIAAAKNNPEIASFREICRNIKVAEAETATLEKLGIFSNYYATHPITGDHIPIWIANYVLMEYGNGAVMAVPAHDQRDFEFAKKYNLKIQPVIKPLNKQKWNFDIKPYLDAGVLINSGQFDELDSNQASKIIIDYLASQNKGQAQIHYRLRDWGVSRQRYWGTPIPMIYCEKCGTVPVPFDQLPVKLPENITLKNPSSPLKDMPEFYQTTCPKCAAPARREIDTFDTFVESSWYYARFTSFNQDQAMLDERANDWLPVDQYVGGIEHAVMHLLYARFIHKVMRDFGLLHCDEPFTRLLTQGMVLKDGAKMSKSKGNTVSPEDMINRFGADTARFFVIFAAPPEQSLEWSDSGVEGAHRFLKRLWHFVATNLSILKNKAHLTHMANKTLRREVYLILQQADFDMQRLQFNTVASATMKLFNILQKINFEKTDEVAVAIEALSILLRILAPITPHICQKLWQNLELGSDISRAGWPKIEETALTCDQIELVVQINGKRRSVIQIAIDADQASIEAEVLKDKNIQTHIAGQVIKKMIIVPKRLINIVL